MTTSQSDEFFFELVESIHPEHVVDAWCPTCQAMADHRKRMTAGANVYLCLRCGMVEYLTDSKFIKYSGKMRQKVIK